jgi:hypothetical protein
VPGREYILFAGPIEAAADNPSGFRSRSASIWWPDDRAWCVATEVDLKTTYIGCPEECRDDLLTRPEIEAFEIDPSSGVDSRSDRLNSAPAG